MALSKITTESLLDGEITAAKFASGAVTPVPKTVQTHVIVASSQSISANTAANITNLNATITPTAGTKILITVRWNGEGANAGSEDTVFGIRRDTTIVGDPDAASSRAIGIAIIAQGFYSSSADSSPNSCFYQYLDSPSTGSAITYHATIKHVASQTLYNNRSVTDTDNGSYERLTSTITLQEVVAP